MKIFNNIKKFDVKIKKSYIKYYIKNIYKIKIKNIQLYEKIMEKLKISYFKNYKKNIFKIKTLNNLKKI